LATLWIKDKGDIVLGSDDPEKIYIEEIRPEKIRLQLEYLHTQSLFLDVTIMIKTIKVHFIDRIINKDRKTN
jgi:lipopolysaccharide/colanic/teichoic acid biosynthesis glycosyltransferase